MADDIVTRLRGHVDVGTIYDDVLSIRNIPTCLEAADEIERLRADRDRWRKVADLCVMAIGVPENDVDRISVREYDKAVRGE